MIIPKRLQTRKELAAMVSISEDTFDRAMKEERFKKVRLIIRGSVRYDAEEFIRIMQEIAKEQTLQLGKVK